MRKDQRVTDLLRLANDILREVHDEKDPNTREGLCTAFDKVMARVEELQAELQQEGPGGA